MTRTLPHVTALLAVTAFAVNCREPAPSAQQSAAPVVPAAAARVAVTVDGDGYHPPTVRVPPGRPVVLAFTRTSDEGCGEQLVFPSLGIRRDLPLNQTVEVPVTAPASGRLAFTCGMNMYRGAIVAE